MKKVHFTDRFCLLAALFSIFAFFPFSQAFSADLKKSQILGKPWYYKKIYLTFFDNGTFLRELRLRKKVVISKCKGTYTTKGNTIYTKDCPRLGEKEHIEVDITTITKDSFKAIRISFSSQLPPEGSRSTLLTYKRAKK